MMYYSTSKNQDRNESRCASLNGRLIIDDPTIDSLHFDCRMARCASAQDYTHIFSEADLHTNLWCLNFKSIERDIYTKEMCSAIPSHINTIEIGLGYIDGRWIHKVPAALEFTPNLQHLIINHPENFCEFKGFTEFLDSLNQLTERAPNLKRISFAAQVSGAYDDDYNLIYASENVTQDTRDNILSSIETHTIEQCFFYFREYDIDKLISVHKPKVPFKNLPLYLNIFLKHNIPAEIITETLLFTKGMNKYDAYSQVKDAFKDSYHRKAYPCATQALLNEYGLFRKVTENYLESNRHQDPCIQEAYDQRFGLVSIGS